VSINRETWTVASRKPSDLRVRYSAWSGGFAQRTDRPPRQAMGDCVPNLLDCRRVAPEVVAELAGQVGHLILAQRSQACRCHVASSDRPDNLAALMRRGVLERDGWTDVFAERLAQRLLEVRPPVLAPFAIVARSATMPIPGGYLLPRQRQRRERRGFPDLSTLSIVHDHVSVTRSYAKVV
jgi:hypothetical protein